MTNVVLYIVVAFLSAGAVLGGVAFFMYRRILRRAKGIERGLKMIPIRIHLPPPSSDTASGNRDVREVMREKVAQAEVLYNLIAGTSVKGFKSDFYGQRHIAFEIIASHGLIHFYTAVPIALVSVVEKAILTAYPGAKLEEAADHNMFNPSSKLPGTAGGEIALREKSAYPIATFKTLERDPMEGLLNAMSALPRDEGAGIQILLRPAPRKWIASSAKIVRKKRRRGGHVGMDLTAKDLLFSLARPPQHGSSADGGKVPLSKLEEEALNAIEEKTKDAGFEVLIRVLASAGTPSRSQQIIHDLVATFSLFESPGLNGFKFVPAKNLEGLVTAFIFRFFPPEFNKEILNAVELATLFHLPDAQFTSTGQLTRQMSKQVDGPANISPSGLLLGYNVFRGVKKEIRLSVKDRQRHTYVIGQTGTGKSTLLENLAVQDMLAGNGFAFIDPHGDTAEKLISMVPKSRVEDIIYFNPADTEYPLGLNLFEFNAPEQKDFLIQESLNMLYKIYDPGKTGIIGPRFEQWYRNAALTLMADPNGSTFIEIPKVFTDNDYLKRKFKYLTDQTVIDFWVKEMGQTSDYHKSEMLGFFVSKFGAFMQNEMMRNIIGQTKSAFDLRDIMDNKKILIVNLSKGKLGDINAKLLGMMFVMKFQAAAMSRADMPEEQRNDFCLYVDEFQNFSTDSFASILSEARKYRLNLIVANQFVGQLTPEIRDAVFGNVGTIMSYRTGPEDAEFLTKQFAPVFDARDLVNIPNHNTVIKLLTGGLPSQPFSMEMLPPLAVANPELGLAVKQLSAAKHGQSKAMVEADIASRLNGKSQPPAAPAQASASAAPAPVASPASSPVTDEKPVSTPVPAPAPVPAPNAIATSVPLGASAVQTATPAPVSVVAATSIAPAPAQVRISDITRTPPRPVVAAVASSSAPVAPVAAPAVGEDDVQHKIDEVLGMVTPKTIAPSTPSVPVAPVITPAETNTMASSAPVESAEVVVPPAEDASVTVEAAVPAAPVAASIPSTDEVYDTATPEVTPRGHHKAVKDQTKGGRHYVDHSKRRKSEDSSKAVGYGHHGSKVLQPLHDLKPAPLDVDAILRQEDDPGEDSPVNTPAPATINGVTETKKPAAPNADIIESHSITESSAPNTDDNKAVETSTEPTAASADIKKMVSDLTAASGESSMVNIAADATVEESASSPLIKMAGEEADKPKIPKLAPGEIYVDEDGNVHQG